MPERVQLRRTKGWRMPPNTVKVSRPSIWGNPYIVGQRGQLVFEPMTDAELLAFDFKPKKIVIDGHVGTATRVPPNRVIPFERPLTIEDVLLLYHKHVLEKRLDLAPLRGKNLACWCKLSEPCHADILLDLANR